MRGWSSAAFPAPSDTAPALQRSVLSDAPVCVRAFAGNDATLENLQASSDRWSGGGIEVEIVRSQQTIRLTLTAPTVPLHRIHLALADTCLGGNTCCSVTRGSAVTVISHGCRCRRIGYCRGISLQRRSAGCTGLGVQVGAGAFAFWQLDSEGVSLWLDVRNGGNGSAARESGSRLGDHNNRLRGKLLGQRQRRYVRQ